MVPLSPVGGLDVARALAGEGASVVVVAGGEARAGAGCFAAELEGGPGRISVFDAGDEGTDLDTGALAEFVGEVAVHRGPAPR